jgi:hypothetical protein
LRARRTPARHARVAVTFISVRKASFDTKTVASAVLDARRLSIRD